MKLKLIKVKDYLLLIDEEAEIKMNDYCVNLDNRISHLPIKVDRRNIGGYGSDKYYWSHKKIIAYYPLTKEAKELDLPLLPNPFEENMLLLLNKDIPSCFSGVKGHEIEDYNKGHRESWIKGYKAAQSKQFSLEDIKRAIEYGHESDAPFLKEHLDNFIQSLSTQQLPKEFIPEYTWEWFNNINDTGWENISPSDMDAIIAHGLKPQPEFRKRLKTKTNSESKQELVGTWKY